MALFYEFEFLLTSFFDKGSIVILGEIKNSVKAFFAPIVLINFYDIFRNEKINIKSRYFAYIAIEYALLLLFANFTGTAFESYIGGKQGRIGWFFAANDISALLVLLLPILYFYAIKSDSKIFIISLFGVIYSLFEIGTKVSVIGVLIILFVSFVLSFINYFKVKNKYKLRKNIILLCALSVFVILLIPNSIFVNNIKLQYYNKINISQNQLVSDISSDEIVNNLIFSGRDEFKKETQRRYKNSNLYQKLFGMGNFDKNGIEYKLIERDQYDLFYNYGIIGNLIYLFSFVILLFKILKMLLHNNITNFFRMNIEVYALSIVLLIGISFYSGHVLLTPTVSLYLSSVVVVLYFKIFNLVTPTHKKNNKKITIMALHLKYGGVEKFISNTSKFLSDNYEVEIVSVYHYPNNQIVSIDERVKVVYLLNEKLLPNREKIISCIKQKNFLQIFKEIFISIKIIILKRIRMIKYIKKCDSAVIISTRIEHNRILSEYGSPNSIKIVTEHNYYSGKYSKKVISSCENVDYFIVSTDDQKKYYEKKFAGNKLKTKKIPFALEYIAEKKSKLKNYNLVSIGRLSPEKGYCDLIEIFSKLNKINRKFNLTIIGEGTERKKLEESIKTLKLDKKIKLVGAKDSKEIGKILLNSSLYLMTSHTESFGIVLIESMNYGVPCIIFDSAKGALELVKHNYNGIVIKDRDSERYCLEIIRIFNEREKLQKMGVNSKKFSDNFTVEKIKKEWIKLLR